MREVFPDLQAFKRLSKTADLVPVWLEIPGDLETPVSCFLKLGDKPNSFLLESVEGGEKIARYSFIGLDADLVFSSKGRKISIAQKGTARSFQTEHDPLFEIQKLMASRRQAKSPGLPPFSGGAVGYLGYDTVRFIEKIPDKNPDKSGIPESYFIFADTLVVFDHVSHRIKILTNAHVHSESAKAVYQKAVQRIRAVASQIENTKAKTLPGVAGSKAPVVTSNFSRAAFCGIVKEAKKYIACGDAFQLVLSQAFQAKIKSHPLNVYRALRSINPSPYMFYIHAGSFCLVGSSPETHVKCEGGLATLRPIAGTRPRGGSEEEDRCLEKELLADPKERAEHLMLVDLGRNDLGRVCEYKTVHAPEFMAVERYSHVMHIVSRVVGRLRKNQSVYDLIRATFPAGTISGAPKVRAMQIIDELENRRRGVYSGIVGYFSYSGDFDSCIAIRTLLIKDGVATVQAGAGVVADSDAKKEYDETVNKARALLRALEAAETGQFQ